MKPLERNLKSLRIPLLLFLGFFCLYMFTAPAKLPEGDEGILLGVADRIARHGFSMMVPSQDESGIFSDYGFFAQGYSKYGLGQSLLAIPVTQAFRKTKTATSDADYIFHLLCLYSLSAATG
ncbi:MAG: hypothetical protein ACE5EK_11225, partial [Nitrospinales bacterium]